MARIPDSFIQDLLARTDLVELVNARVPLKKAGRNYTACCPFHQEKTPSFSVAPDKQFYYCFGCGATGNAVGFLMEYDRLSFPEAVEQLAARAGVEVPKEEGPRAEQSRQQRDRVQTLYDLLSRADRFYRQQLKSAPERKPAVDYLKGRGLTGDIAQRYGIGYAPPGFDNLMTGLSLDQQGIEQALLAGLLVRRDDNQRTYDKFRDRIMFPIRDSRGRTIGFGGRVLGDAKPKYLNSPETPVFHKGQELYGLWEWRQSKEKHTRLFVVEGYMDVIALAQNGIDNSVATLGTATTEEHAVKLFRQVDEVVFCFDGDNAGRRAAWRALESTLPALEDGKQARFLFLPDGEDPDTLVRKQGRETFLVMADKAPSLSTYLFDHLSEGLDLDSVDGRARLAKLALPFLQKVKGQMFSKLLRRELAALTRLQEDELALLTEQTRPAPPAPVTSAPRNHAELGPPDHAEPPPWLLDDAEIESLPTPRQRQARESGTHFSLADRLLLTLFDYPEVLAQSPLPAGIEDLDDPQLDLLVEIAALVNTQPDISQPELLGTLLAHQQGELVAEAMRRAEAVPRDPPRGLRSWQDGVCALEIRHLELRLHQEERGACPDIRQLAELHKRLAEAKARQRAAHH